VAHERAQEIDPVRARDLARYLARDLDITSAVDQEAGAAKRKRRARGRLELVAGSSYLGRLEEQARGLHDPLVGKRAMLQEHGHQPVGEHDLCDRLLLALSRNRFERAPDEHVDVPSEELRAYRRVDGTDVHPPAFRGPCVDCRLQGGSQ
jgi:hypothetical protein